MLRICIHRTSLAFAFNHVCVKYIRVYVYTCRYTHIWSVLFIAWGRNIVRTFWNRLYFSSGWWKRGLHLQYYLELQWLRFLPFKSDWPGMNFICVYSPVFWADTSLFISCQPHYSHLKSGKYNNLSQSVLWVITQEGYMSANAWHIISAQWIVAF